MATEDKVILELLKSDATLTSDNPILELGQRVFVTGITDSLINGEKIGDNSTAYTSLKWQRYELLKNIDLTSADVTYTLPKILGGSQRVSVYWTNGGTYKMTLAVSNSETVDGLAAGTWLGEGEGHLIVESDDTNWKVVDYEDKGSNTNGEWIKDINKKLKCLFQDTVQYITTTAWGNIFLTPSAITFTFPKAFIAIPIIKNAGGFGNAGSVVWQVTYNKDTTTTSVTLRLLSSVSSGQGVYGYEAIGDWA